MPTLAWACYCSSWVFRGNKYVKSCEPEPVKVFFCFSYVRLTIVPPNLVCSSAIHQEEENVNVIFLLLGLPTALTDRRVAPPSESASLGVGVASIRYPRQWVFFYTTISPCIAIVLLSDGGYPNAPKQPERRQNLEAWGGESLTAWLFLPML
jgi:hypothetical protein